ncbi:hypothetical protein D3C76_322360 [compost metagenome]|jgi:hypothetical protein|uniref:Uncharacterized protein n=1 Tax=Pseudomonas fluorescens TaxID=294 RepID=A0A5E7MX89_PSEFL|nr:MULTISPECIES: hypothetical protein [Pseudomonas]VVM79050.1 hypothetical protein PS673_02179 [Pseudomonas fluorescens]VVP28783.1 hypothetical protein PS843_04177 [Pseudomonas fluorescens]
MKSLSSETYIVDGNITLFLGEHSEQFKKDVLHSSLLGNLLADSTPGKWFTSYRTVLDKFYWALNGFKNYALPKKSASLFSIASTALADALQKEQLQQLGNALSNIAQLPSEAPARKALLNRIQKEIATSHGEGSLTVSTLLTIVCENKKNISLQMSFETTRPVDITFLRQPLPETVMQGDIETSLWTTYLSEDKYAKIRNQVVGKLGSKPQTHLFQILEPAPAY